MPFIGELIWLALGLYALERAKVRKKTSWEVIAWIVIFIGGAGLLLGIAGILRNI